MNETWVVDGYNAGKVAPFTDTPKEEGQEDRERELHETIIDRLTHWASDAQRFNGGMRRFADYLVRRFSLHLGPHVQSDLLRLPSLTSS